MLINIIVHSRTIIHGDLTGSNVLITANFSARLCDFGLSSAIQSVGTGQSNDNVFGSASVLRGGAVRWADISLYRNHGHGQSRDHAPTLNKTSDIYSFGSVMLELLTSRIPYSYVTSDMEVVIRLDQGEKPRRPAQQFVTDEQWEFMQWCWMDRQEDRPVVEEVLTHARILWEHLGD